MSINSISFKIYEVDLIKILKDNFMSILKAKIRKVKFDKKEKSTNMEKGKYLSIWKKQSIYI